VSIPRFIQRQQIARDPLSDWHLSGVGTKPRFASLVLQFDWHGWHGERTEGGGVAEELVSEAASPIDRTSWVWPGPEDRIVGAKYRRAAPQIHGNILWVFLGGVPVHPDPPIPPGAATTYKLLVPSLWWQIRVQFLWTDGPLDTDATIDYAMTWRSRSGVSNPEVNTTV
jgi:hypothetical protein